MDVSLRQLLKASLSINTTVFGMVIDTRLRHDENVAAPTVLSALGKRTMVRLTQ